MNTIEFIKQYISIKRDHSLLSASKRYPNYFKISDIVIRKLHVWIDRGENIQPNTFLGCCKMGSLIRAFNLYKSINLLLRNDHWEDAAILARAMFELLLNLEEIIKDEKMAESLACKYLRFQKLQKYLHTIHIIDYEIKTDRRPSSDMKRREELEKLADQLFGEFKDKKSKTGWSSSWCGKTIYNLAQNARNKMHLSNYKILYSLFSDIAHSGPTSLATSFMLGDTPEETQKLFSNIEHKDKENILMVLTMSTNWLLELLVLGRSELRLFDLDFCMDIMKRTKALYEKDLG